MIVTTQQVADLVGVTVTDGLIGQAQYVVSTEAGVDLTDADGFALLPARDQRALRTAVVWEALYLSRNPDALTRVGNVVQAGANGVSVTYSSGDDGTLAPLAVRALEGLSWRRQAVTVTTLRASAPPIPRPQPDPWVTLG